MYVHGMGYLHHEVQEVDGYDQEFWKTLGYSLFKMCSRVSCLNFSRESTFKGTPPDWALANIFEDLDFLSHYPAANRMKPFVARSTNGIVI